jgi:hypothetical protein
LFFKRANSLDSFVPLCLLLVLNIAALVTDASSPSPIAFYTLVNIYLFLCLTAILGFELYRNFSGTRPELALVPSVTTPTPAKRRKHKAR